MKKTFLPFLLLLVFASGQTLFGMEQQKKKSRIIEAKSTHIFGLCQDELYTVLSFLDFIELQKIRFATKKLNQFLTDADYLNNPKWNICFIIDFKTINDTNFQKLLDNLRQNTGITKIIILNNIKVMLDKFIKIINHCKNLYSIEMFSDSIIKLRSVKRIKLTGEHKIEPPCYSIPLYKKKYIKVLEITNTQLNSTYNINTLEVEVKCTLIRANIQLPNLEKLFLCLPASQYTSHLDIKKAQFIMLAIKNNRNKMKEIRISKYFYTDDLIKTGANFLLKLKEDTTKVQCTLLSQADNNLPNIYDATRAVASCNKNNANKLNLHTLKGLKIILNKPKNALYNYFMHKGKRNLRCRNAQPTKLKSKNTPHPQKLTIFKLKPPRLEKKTIFLNLVV
jgi:hypothetical protein